MPKSSKPSSNKLALAECQAGMLSFGGHIMNPLNQIIGADSPLQDKELLEEPCCQCSAS